MAQWTAFAAFAALLAACSTDEPKSAPPPAAAAAPAPLDTAPAVDSAPLPNAEAATKVEMYPGTGAVTSGGHLARTPSIGGSDSDDNGITLNFINTDVKDVAKAVLGDYLKLNYEIGANVQGVVTIQTSQPLKRS